LPKLFSKNGSIRKKDSSSGDFNVSDATGITKAESDDENASKRLLDTQKGERKRSK